MTYEVKEVHTKDGIEYQKVEISGLSTEDKPVDVNGTPFWNGSTFFEMDTRKVFFWSMLDYDWLGD